MNTAAPERSSTWRSSARAPRIGDRHEGEVGPVAGQVHERDGDAVGGLERDGRAGTAGPGRSSQRASVLERRTSSA